jgi:hypothetical protein
VTRTRTRVHVTIQFADPHLICERCRQPVTGWHDPEQCGPGCDAGTFNLPCECRHGGVTSVCPSWSPVDGCTCTPRHIPPNGADR